MKILLALCYGVTTAIGVETHDHSHEHESFSQSLWCTSQIRNEILV